MRMKRETENKNKEKNDMAKEERMDLESPLLLP